MFKKLARIFLKQRVRNSKIHFIEIFLNSTKTQSKGGCKC